MISVQIDRVRRVVVGKEDVDVVYTELVESVHKVFRPNKDVDKHLATIYYRDDLIFLAATYFEQERQQQLQRERRGDA